MVISCVAYQCSKEQGDVDQHGRKLSFYRFPSETKDPQLRAQWVHAVKRDGWTPTEYSRLCSAHFISGKGHIYT